MPSNDFGKYGQWSGDDITQQKKTFHIYSSLLELLVKNNFDTLAAEPYSAGSSSDHKAKVSKRCTKSYTQ